MRQPVYWSGIVLAVIGLSVAAAKERQPDGFFYAMQLEAANELLQKDSRYEVIYRIDTPSTADIFCNYQQKTQYLAHFLHGECIGVEKRAVVEAAAMDGMFAAYAAALGEPSEGAVSQDSKTHYAHWAYKDRELELTALRRGDGRYLLIHEEYDPRRAGEAKVLQERELKDGPAGAAQRDRQRLVAE